MRIWNNIYMNGPAATETNDHGALHFDSNVGDGVNLIDLNIKNNVFTALGAAYAINDDIYDYDRLNTYTLTHNYAYKTSGDIVFRGTGGGSKTYSYQLFSDTGNSGDDYEDCVADLITCASASSDLGTANDNTDETDPQVTNGIPDSGSPLIDGADAITTMLDPDTDFTSSPPSVITMSGDEIGPYGYEDAPPGPGGDTGLWNLLGGGNVLNLGGSQTIELSGATSG
jgi:hypothetical protein